MGADADDRVIGRRRPVAPSLLLLLLPKRLLFSLHCTTARDEPAGRTGDARFHLLSLTVSPHEWGYKYDPTQQQIDRLSCSTRNAIGECR